MVDQLWE